MRKKLFTFLLALVTSVGMMYAWTSGDCTVTLNAGVVTVSGTGAMGNYTYFTQTPWYSSRNSITSIIIEDGVTNVGDYAFMRLDNLQSVVIGNDVVTIGSHAFEQCGSSFTSLTLGNSIVEIGEQAFINNSRITSINLPNTLQTIGEDAFYGCTRISSLTIPSSVTSIGDYAFGGCSLIAYIIAEPTTPPSTEENTFISIVTPSYIPLYVPNGSVADYTAAERWNTFNIQGYDPSTGPTIEPVPATPDQLSGAFTINGDGDQINFSKGNLQYVGSWQFAENQWNIIGNDQADNNRDLFGWGTGDAPNKVSTTLADYAVYHEWGTNMGDGWYTLSKDEWTYLFQSRTNAANLYAPAKVNGVNGFVILPDEFTLPSGLSFTAGVTNYGTNFYANAAWRAMENAGAVFLPVDGYRYDGNKIKWVGQDGFYWSSTVASEGASAWSWLISASNGARRDYYNLHYGMCVRLVKAAAPSGGSTLANVCGDGLTWELSEGVLTISYDGEGTGEMYDFGYEYDENPVNVAPWKENKSDIATVVIGDGVKSIGNYAFNDLGENFTAVTIANSVERIGLSAFMNAKWVTEMTLPSALQTIDKEGFAANFGLTSITIPSGVTSIGNKAFCYCTALTSLTCEATTPPTLASSVFYKIRSSTSSISSIPLYVPSASVAAYQAAAQWNAFNIQAIPSAPTYLDADFAIDFSTDPYTKVGGGDLPAGVLVEGSMNTSDAAHGYRLPVITIPVTAGNYKVMMGTCSYSNQDATIKTEDGSHTYATLATNNGTCYHNNTTANVVGAIFNVPSDQVIKVYGAEYTPFFSIEKMEDVPAFTDFEINFRTDPYDMISGAKPEGTVIIGTYHDNLHGYQNVEAVVPVEAGNYRLTVGACQYGTPGNVMSETNAILASFNSNLGEGNCYHNNTAANIVSTIFTVDIDQTITIDCGEYTPYMKLEKLQDNTYYINFENAEGAIGTVPGEIAITVGESWTIPANMTLYKEGYTFVGWSDGVNTYAPGDEFFPSAHGTLEAVYTPNTVSIAAASTINVKWYFGESNGAPSVTWNGAAGYLLAKGEVDGQMIDLKLDIDATASGAKFDNAGRADKWAQVNANTVFTFPSKEGAVVNVETYSGNETYDLGNGTLTCNTNDYYSYLEIVYPAPTTAVVIGDPNNADQVTDFLTAYDGQLVPDLTIDRPVKNNMYNTLCLPFHMDADQIANSSLNGVEIYEFVDVDVTNDELYLYTSEEKHEIVAGRPYLVKYSAASQLDDLDFVNVTINNADLDDQAVTIKGVTFKGTFQPVVLGQQTELNFNGGHLFLGQNNTLYWPNTANPLKPFRAYFTVNVDAGQSAGMPMRRGMPAHIGEPAQVPTGVENVQGDNVQSTKVVENGVLYIIKNGVKYNAQGQVVK